MTHPIVACAADIRASLKGVASVNPTFMSTDDKATALGELVRAEAQLVELRLRVLADAGDLAVATAAKDAAGWLAKETRTRFADARADLALATALDREHPVLAAAMREGDVTLAQAQVIRRALAALPVERRRRHRWRRPRRTWSAQAGVFGPKELARLGRRILDVVAPEIAEEAEARRLAELEANAAAVDPVHDAPSGRRHHPDLRAAPGCGRHTARHLPRGLRQPPQGPRPPARTRPRGDPFTRLPYPRRMGEALCQFLESIDITRLPIHGGDATTLVITMSLDSLRAELATADLIGAGLVPGDEPPATPSPQPRPGGWPAPRRSCPPSSAATASRSTSAEPGACSAPDSARHS